MPACMPENSAIRSPAPTPGKGVAVQRLFGAIARRYDLANHLLSAGLDFGWRRRAARIVRRWNPAVILDLATGSGDLARSLQRACPQALVAGADFCLPMLRIARRKRLQHLVQADALNLPFASGTFDIVTIAFGLRNIESWPAALAEMARVLRPGGHVLILDFSIPTGRLGPAYRFYLHKILPAFASIVTGEKSAYQYLGDSIETFPQSEIMCRLINEAGFRDAACEQRSAGIVSFYTARRQA